jgi:hypothetical protein
MSKGNNPYYAREPRLDLELPCKLFFLGLERAGMLVNISLSGGFLVLKNPPGLRTVLAMTVEPPKGEPIVFNGMVVRLEPRGAGREGCAVQFLNLSPEAEGRLSYLLRQHQKVPKGNPEGL